MGVAALGGIGEAFGDANFRRYTVGSVVSWLTFFVQAVAIGYVLQEHLDVAVKVGLSDESYKLLLG